MSAPAWPVPIRVGAPAAKIAMLLQIKNSETLSSTHVQRYVRDERPARLSARTRLR
jgi:hypothetical protein